MKIVTGIAIGFAISTALCAAAIVSAPWPKLTSPENDQAKITFSLSATALNLFLSDPETDKPDTLNATAQKS